MAVTPFTQLACPLDGEPLQRDSNTWRCPQGHSFDVAKQGYVNLLPVQNKRSRDPGDSKAMMVARQEFLAAGFYQPIADAVADAVLNGADSSAALSCLDAGCGEGYYLRQLAAQSGAAHGSASQVLNLLGLDISKWAVQAAARQDKQVSWVVGNNANLPVLPGTLDRVLCMFGFPVYPEFLRVLKPGGKLLMVDAGADHLRELREIIYPTLKPARPPQAQPPAGFVEEELQQLRFSVHLPDTQQIQNLLIMTPHLYRASAEGRARAEQLTELTVTVDVRLSTLVKMRRDAEPNQQ
ncbi:methyltransferase domain-containing protein [Pseudohongiella sp. SYSU M77423]|uniref:putative RNA methyltransferase n=1 Tax=Pseudohongiella sp. SYSU M77423 TaxID=3042312 RepID=UPI0024814B85|nr:methyltransferase domain-containing protein [Pseudohongiella sp. SYSU M77423]MDH7942532.1 methyltransferase domain-containing protein [Pseudohongiella sp. SYSU M77423]